MCACVRGHVCVCVCLCLCVCLCVCVSVWSHVSHVTRQVIVESDFSLPTFASCLFRLRGSTKAIAGNVLCDLWRMTFED